MAKESDLAKDNCIALFRVGSHLYGTSTKDSDTDIEGLFIEPPEYVIGRKKILEVNCSTKKGNVPGIKNTKDDEDLKYYTVNNFFGLAALGNPNKVEWFFIPEEHILFKNEKYLKMILDAKHLFLSRKIRHSFQGYAYQQKNKLLTKKKRLEELRSFEKVLQENIKKGAKLIGDLDVYETISTKRYDPETEQVNILKNKRIRGGYDYIKYHMTEEGSDAVKVDDKIYNWGMDIEKIYDHVSKEVAKYGQRTQLLDEYGFDLKFCGHMFRLIEQGKELLETGKITFPVRNSEFIREIRAGKYDLDFLLEKAKGYEEQFDASEQNSPLPYSPDHAAIHDLQMKIYLEYWREKGWI